MARLALALTLVAVLLAAGDTVATTAGRPDRHRLPALRRRVRRGGESLSPSASAALLGMQDPAAAMPGADTADNTTAWQAAAFRQRISAGGGNKLKLPSRECGLPDVVGAAGVARIFHLPAGAGNADIVVCPLSSATVAARQIRATLIDFGSLASPRLLLAYARALFHLLLAGDKALLIRFIFTHHDKDHYNQARKLMTQLQMDYGDRVSFETQVLVGGSVSEWKEGDRVADAEYTALNRGHSCRGTTECLQGIEMDDDSVDPVAAFVHWCDPSYRPGPVAFHIEQANVNDDGDKNANSAVIVLQIVTASRDPFVQRFAGDAFPSSRSAPPLQHADLQGELLGAVASADSAATRTAAASGSGGPGGPATSDSAASTTRSGTRRRATIPGIATGPHLALSDTVLQPPHHVTSYLDPGFARSLDLSQLHAIVLSGPRLQNAMMHGHPACSTIVSLVRNVAEQRGVTVWAETSRPHSEAGRAADPPLFGCFHKNAPPEPGRMEQMQALSSWLSVPWNVLAVASDPQSRLWLLSTSARGDLPNMIVTVVALQGADTLPAATAEAVGGGVGPLTRSRARAVRRARTLAVVASRPEADGACDVATDAHCGFVLLPSYYHHAAVRPAPAPAPVICFGMFARPAADALVDTTADLGQ